MQEERMKILEMLAEGKVSTSEAERLLRAVETEPAAQAKAEETLSKLGQVVERFVGGRARETAETEDDAGHWGEPVENPSEGFPMPPEASLSVRTKGRSVEIVQEDGLEAASVTWEGEDAPVLRREGTRFRLTARPGGNLLVRIPRIAAVTARCTGGNLALRGLTTSLQAKVTGGNLSARQFEGQCEVQCTGGNAEIGGRLSSIEAKCTGGNLRLDGLCMTSGRHKVKCLGGSTSLGVLPDASVLVEAKAFGGNVSAAVPAEDQKGFGPATHYRFRFGSGAARLKASSLGGGIEIQQTGQDAPEASAR
jgi:hypothetical protein